MKKKTPNANNINTNKNSNGNIISSKPQTGKIYSPQIQVLSKKT